MKWGIDLQSEHERYLTETLVGRPVVVMNYPKQIKAFYMRLNDDGKTVAAMDVLAPGIGEIIGGIAARGAAGRARRRGSTRSGSRRSSTTGTATCGGTAPCRTPASASGFERTIVYVTGMVNIRDVIPFPRTPGNAEF